jgi:hypothetical protein
MVTVEEKLRKGMGSVYGYKCSLRVLKNEGYGLRYERSYVSAGWGFTWTNSLWYIVNGMNDCLFPSCVFLKDYIPGQKKDYIDLFFQKMFMPLHRGMSFTREGCSMRFDD